MKSSIEFCMDAIEDMRKEPDELIAKYQDTLWSIINELDVVANGVDNLQAENEMFRRMTNRPIWHENTLLQAENERLLKLHDGIATNLEKRIEKLENDDQEFERLQAENERLKEQLRQALTEWET